jgi:hypothetical protein
MGEPRISGHLLVLLKSVWLLESAEVMRAVRSAGLKSLNYSLGLPRIAMRRVFQISCPEL